MTQVDVPTAGFDPSHVDVRRDPYPHYHWLLRNDPVHRGVNGIWFVTRYADVRAVLGDERFARAGIRDFWASIVGEGALSGILTSTLLFQDEPEHTRLRSLIAGWFGPRAVRDLEQRIDRVVAELLTPALARGRMDVINDLAYPLALTVITSILGLPQEDLARIRAWSLAIGPTLDLAASPQEIALGQTAMAEITEYLTGRTAGLLGELAPVLSHEEIVSMGVTLIFAGHETVTNQIGNGVLALLRHPDQLALLRDRPGLVPGAVEEVLRYDSAVQSNSRQLTDDVELGGRTLRRGEFAVAVLGAANRDPAQFADPDRFDVTRTGVRPMSFGTGIRHCVGAVLARLELTAAFRALVRLPGLELAGSPDDLVYHRSTMFRGVLSLPVTFTAGT